MNTESQHKRGIISDAGHCLLDMLSQLAYSLA